MPNVQWMSYSFVWLYLIKCVVCVLDYMFDQTKKIFDHFIWIWKWFLSLFVFMFSAYFVFHCFKHVVLKNRYQNFSRLTCDSWNWKNAFSSHFWFSGREVCFSLASEHSSHEKDLENFMKIVFATHLTTCLVAKLP